MGEIRRKVKDMAGKGKSCPSSTEAVRRICIRGDTAEGGTRSVDQAPESGLGSGRGAKRIRTVLTSQLKLQTKKENEWTTCFELPLDLPDHPFIGFSALTGDVSDDHEWVFLSAFRRVVCEELIASQHHFRQHRFAHVAARVPGRSQAEAHGCERRSQRGREPQVDQGEDEGERTEEEWWRGRVVPVYPQGA